VNFVDTYSKVTFVKLNDRETPITAADLLNDRVAPYFDEKEVKLLRGLTDRGTEYCGNPAHHEYEIYHARRRTSITRAPRRRARKFRQQSFFPRNRIGIKVGLRPAEAAFGEVVGHQDAHATANDNASLRLP